MAIVLWVNSCLLPIRDVAANGNGKILANFREIPALCRPIAEEAGIEAENHAMSTIIEYQSLIKFWELIT